MWPLDNSNANQSAIDASHSSPRRESSSSPRLDRFRGRKVGIRRRFISLGFGGSISVGEEYRSFSDKIRFETIFFFFFPTLGDPLLSLCIESGVAIFFFFFFFWFEILFGISGTRQPPFESKDTRCFFVFLFFFFAVRCE